MEIIGLAIGVIALSLSSSALAQIKALKKEIAGLKELIEKTPK
jgi:ribosomal protein L18E